MPLHTHLYLLSNGLSLSHNNLFFCLSGSAHSKPIEAGVAKDARQSLRDESKSKTLHLHEICQQFVHRVDKECIRNDLPDFYDTLLYLQPSVVQQKILRKYDKSCRDHPNSRNFFRYDILTAFVLAFLIHCIISHTKNVYAESTTTYHRSSTILVACILFMAMSGLETL